MIVLKNTILVGLKKLEAMSNRCTRKSLNDIAFLIQNRTKTAIPTWIKIKKPYFFVVKIDKATDNNLKTHVGFPLKTEPVLELTETGGTRFPKKGRKGILVRMPRRPRSMLKIKKRKSSREYVFSKKIKNIQGVWFLKRNTLRLLSLVKDRTEYKGGMVKFRELAADIYTKHFAIFMKRNFNK